MGRFQVLIADDDPDVLTVVRMALCESYDIVEARDGLAAWALFEEVRPRLVVTDLNMPGLNGLDLTEKIRAHEELGETPVVILTGTTQDTDLPGGFWRIGTKASVFLEKPVNLDVLLNTVRRLLMPREAKPLPPGKGHY